MAKHTSFTRGTKESHSMRNWLHIAKRRRWGAWNCAVYALLAVAGFITLNVAGCGGGGGGNPDPINPLPVNITIRLRDSAGNVVEGTGRLQNGKFTSNFTTTNGDT